MHVLMFLGGWRWGGVCGLITFSCTSVHKSCYAAVYVLLQVHTCIMLRCCKVSRAFTHLRENNLRSLGQALDKQWVWVKILIPRQLCAHTKDKTFQNLGSIRRLLCDSKPSQASSATKFANCKSPRTVGKVLQCFK